MSNLIKLSDKYNDARLYTIEDMLDEVKERVQENPQIKKAVVILFDETAEYTKQILWHVVGTTRREHLGLLSRAKDEYMMDWAFEHTHV